MTKIAHESMETAIIYITLAKKQQDHYIFYRRMRFDRYPKSSRKC